jgi:hypothetical protein
VEEVMDKNIYNERRATIMNALYCSVRSAMETKNITDEFRVQWIVDDLKVAHDKVTILEEEFRKYLGDPFVDDGKEVV